MRTRSIPMAIALLVLCAAGTASAIPDDQAPGQKGRRDKALAALDKEVGKLLALVKNADKMSPCGGAAPATPPGAPARMRVRARLSGAPFCPDKYAPFKKRLKELIAEVNDNSGNDSRAGAVISFWPQFVESFETQLTNLAEMKKNQKSAVLAGDLCKMTTSELVSHAKTAVVNKSLDEFDLVQDEATKDKTNVTAWVSAQESTRSSMDQWERNSRLFEPAGNYDKAWKPVYKALHASSKKIRDQWNVDWVTASKLCAEPAKGEDHAELRKLEDKLYDSLKAELVSDLEKWRVSAKELYRYDCDSMKKLQEYYCSVRDGDGEVTLDEFEADSGESEVDEDFPVDGDSEDVQYVAQADKMAADMQQKEHAVWTEIGAIRSRADRLAARRNGRMDTIDAYKVWVAEMTKFNDTQIAPEEKAILEVVDRGIFRGSRNPKIQLWIEFGKQQHSMLEKQDQFACTLADAEYCRYRYRSGPKKDKCARKTRPDCVSVTQCKVWEFKPVNGKDRGEKQVARYKRLLEKHYNKALELFRDDNLGSFEVVGDTPVLKALEAGCAHGGTLTFEKEVYRYPKCGADLEYQCSPKAK